MITAEIDNLTVSVLETLNVDEYSSWETVFKQAKKRGEGDGYAAFLANEHARIYHKGLQDC